MNTKALIWIGITVGSIVGGYLGGLLDHGNILGGWSIIGGTIGSILGIWAGYKLSRMY
jgi:hypothetical protein